MKRFVRWPYLVALVATAAYASVQILGQDGSSIAKVDTNLNLRISAGPSTRQTFVATIAGATTTAAYNLQIESPAATGIKILEICVTYSVGATAAGTIVTTTVSRRTTASSAGTALVNNGTGTVAVTDLSGAAVAYGGLARGMAATLGTVGATIDQWHFRQSVLPATTAVEMPDGRVCQQYGSAAGGGMMAITVPAGATNGLSVLVSAGGAGSVATGSIRITFINE